MTTWAKDALERAAKSAAQTLVLTWTSGQLDVFHVDWKQTAGLVVGAALLSLLTSVGSAKVGTPGTASLVAAEGPVD